MADQEVIKHVKAAIEATRDKKKSWKHKVQEILLEVGIIVFAVSLSIWLHGWAEDRKDRREEREFLTGLKQDLAADREEMIEDRRTFMKELKAVAYFERVGSGEKLNPDSVKAYNWLLVNTIQINPRISRFEALKGSGKIGIIENKGLLLQITELYAKDFPAIIETNNYVTALKQNLLVPFLASRLELDQKGDPVNWDKVLVQSQMRIMIGQQETVGNNIERYTRGIGDCEKIMEEIGRETK